MKRAGLDYWHLVDLHVYESLDDFFARHRRDPDLWLTTTKAPGSYTEAAFRDGCWLFFGKETAGLPEAPGAAPGPLHPHPHRAEARSLNLANTVAVRDLRGPAPAGLSRPDRRRRRAGRSPARSEALPASI